LEREPLHVARNAPGYFSDIYGVADIEESLVAALEISNGLRSCAPAHRKRRSTPM